MRTQWTWGWGWDLCVTDTRRSLLMVQSTSNILTDLTPEQNWSVCFSLCIHWLSYRIQFIRIPGENIKKQTAVFLFSLHIRFNGDTLCKQNMFEILKLSVLFKYNLYVKVIILLTFSNSISKTLIMEDFLWNFMHFFVQISCEFCAKICTFPNFHSAFRFINVWNN